MFKKKPKLNLKFTIKMSEQEMSTERGINLFAERMRDKFLQQTKRPVFKHYEITQQELDIILNLSKVLRKFIFRFNFVCLKSYLKNNKTVVLLTSYEEAKYPREIGKILGRRLCLR